MAGDCLSGSTFISSQISFASEGCRDPQVRSPRKNNSWRTSAVAGVSSKGLHHLIERQPGGVGDAFREQACWSLYNADPVQNIYNANLASR